MSRAPEPTGPTLLAKRYRVTRRQVAGFGARKLLGMTPAARELVISQMRSRPLYLRRRTIAAYWRICREKSQARAAQSKYHRDVARGLARMTGDRVRVLGDEVQRRSGSGWVAA